MGIVRTAALLAAFALAGLAASAQDAASLVAAVESAMVRVEAGSFVMGSEAGRPNARPPHEVRLTRSFRMLRHELCFEEYDAYCALAGEAPPRDAGWGRGRRPVVFVSYYAAARFCNFLSEAAGLVPCYSADGRSCDLAASGYRLPTEAEWEYAARGGAGGPGQDWAGSGDPAEVACFGEADRPLPVESKSPNALGIYDLSGNVHEWCNDWYAFAYYAASPPADPPGPAAAEADRAAGIKRVRRGGNYHESAESAKVYARSCDLPTQADAGMGFRIVRIE